MNNKGFTLIELLIVIAIIGILAAAVLVAVDPVGRIREARNARRWSESNAILNAVLNRQVDDRNLYGGTGSTYPVVASDSAAQIIVTTDSPNAAATCSGVTLGSGNAKFVNVSNLAPTHIAQIPADPSGGSYGADNTGYYFRRSTAGRITIGSCNPEGNPAPVISVTR